MRRKGSFQYTLCFLATTAIYFRHLLNDLVHIDRLRMFIELIAPVKIDMLPGNRRDFAEPGRVFNISGVVHVVVEKTL